jgi:transketolase
VVSFSKENLRDTFGRTLVELGAEHGNLLVLDADLNTSTRTVLFKERYPDRFIQCGIAEGTMFGLAAGLARSGFITVPTTFAAFATRKALDQVFMNICTERADVKIAGSYVGLTATECGPSHNEVSDLAVMRSLPGMRVAAPGDHAELASLMRTMMQTEGPVYFRVPKVEPPILFDDGYEFRWGKGRVLREGGDVSLVGTGMMTAVLLRAAELLADRRIEAEVIHVPSVKPLDEELLAASAARTGRVLTIENGRVAGGFGGAVAEALGRLAPCRIESMGIGDVNVESAPLEDLLRLYGLTPSGVVARALALCRSKSAVGEGVG